MLISPNCSIIESSFEDKVSRALHYAVAVMLERDSLSLIFAKKYTHTHRAIPMKPSSLARSLNISTIHEIATTTARDYSTKTCRIPSIVTPPKSFATSNDAACHQLHQAPSQFGLIICAKRTKHAGKTLN